MVVLLIRSQQGQSNFISDSKLEELLVLFNRYNLQGENIFFYSTHEYKDSLTEIGIEKSWTDLGSRDPNNFESLSQNCLNYLYGNRYLIANASYEEIAIIRQAYGLKNEETEGYDVLVVYVTDIGCEEFFAILDQAYNPQLGLQLQIQKFITQELFPLITGFEMEQAFKSKGILGDLKSTQKKLQRCIEISQNLEKNKEERKKKETEKRVTEIYSVLQKLNSDIVSCSDKSVAILGKLEYVSNTDEYNNGVKYASHFAETQLELNEVQNPDHSLHLITIRNTTHYYWDSLSLFVPETRIIIASDISLSPHETINPGIDYNFDWIAKFGVISMQVLFGKISVSNKVDIPRVLLEDLKETGKIHELQLKNQGHRIDECRVEYYSKGKKIQSISTSFANYSSKRLAINALVRGQEYAFKVFGTNNLALSVQQSFIA